jgi:hypothetical protein
MDDPGSARLRMLSQRAALHYGWSASLWRDIRLIWPVWHLRHQEPNDELG